MTLNAIRVIDMQLQGLTGRVFAAAMNEITWARVQQWESLHRHECSDPRLRRFLGRPHDLR